MYQRRSHAFIGAFIHSSMVSVSSRTSCSLKTWTVLFTSVSPRSPGGWRCSTLNGQNMHKRMFGNMLRPHCRPSLAHQLTPRAAAFRLPLACSPWNPVSRATGGRSPGGHVHLSLSILVTGSVNPSSFMAHTLFSGLPGRALFPRSTPHLEARLCGPRLRATPSRLGFPSLSACARGCSARSPGI